MHLKSIELENFKSFGGKVTIPLMDGYMAVTGPNGSGKSNIGDAIMFVLGPRSPKAVRASRIPDLVYSDANKGKADHMKATLVFENSDRILPWDADEVRLTRYIRLKGENKDDYVSYFYINDQQQKLADFEALLSKARISADGYNIVQQGDVTHIIQMGSVERRRILDGISGISSFDADLERAQREHQEADAALERIGIIRNEKAANLAVLEKQKAEALRYREAKEKADHAQAQLSVRLRDNEKNALASRQEALSKLEGEISEIAAARDVVSAEAAENEKAIQAKEEEIAARAGEEYTRAKTEVEDAKVALGTANNIRESKLQQAKEEDEFIAQLRQKIEDNTHERNDVQNSIADTRTNLEEVRAKKAEADKLQKKLSEELQNVGGEVADVQKRIDRLNGEIDTKNAEHQDLETKAASARAVAEAAAGRVKEARDVFEAAQYDFKNAEFERNETLRTHADSDTESIGNELAALVTRERTLSKQEQDLRDIHQKKLNQFHKLSAERSANEAVNGGGEAYNRILALKKSGQIRGIHGAVCDLARVDSGYEIAAGVAAGAKARAIVVEDDSVAAACIRYLNENRLGRVTFLPLNKMQPGRPSAKAIMILKQTLGYMTDFVDFKPEYANVFWYVFGDTLVTSDLDKARAIMGGVRIVTKDGNLLEKSGATTGGTLNKNAIPKFGSAAASSSELDALAAEVTAAEAALHQASDELRELREKMRSLQDRLNDAHRQGADVQKAIATANANYEAAKKTADKARDDLQRAEQDLKKVSEAAEAAAQLSEAAAQALQELRDQLAQARQRMDQIAPAELRERADKARAESYALSMQENDLQALVNGAEVEIKGLDNQKKDYEDQIAHATKTAEALRREAADTEAEIERLTVELDAKEAIRQQLESGQEALRAERDALIEKRYSLLNRIESARKDIEVKQGIMDSNRGLIMESEARLAELEAAVAAIPGEVPVNPPSEETIRRALREYTAALDALPNVNMAAIEQYDIELQAVTAIDQEVATLNDRIKALEDLQEEISAKKKGIFMEAYNAIDTNFKALFAELSGGGEASMALENPDDPFEGGLFINAKPRNGMLLRLEALSGGEKSLTALAFIFAIQEYQPSPFYVLDEVDMFLDAVNTELVATHIKTQSGHTQFIQVSLRKVALTKADNLIGVTRPPSGISKIIMQVDMASLDKLEEEAQKRQKENQSN